MRSDEKQRINDARRQDLAHLLGKDVAIYTKLN